MDAMISPRTIADVAAEVGVARLTIIRWEKKGYVGPFERRARTNIIQLYPSDVEAIRCVANAARRPTSDQDHSEEFIGHPPNPVAA